MENPRHVVVVSCLIRNAADQVLLIRHHKRGWEMPQGRVEEGESLLDALHREVAEETGVTVESGPLAAVWSKLSPPAAIIFTFLARYTAGELRCCEEAPEVAWVTPDKALQLVVHPVTRDRLLALLDYSGEVVYRAYTFSPYQVHVEDVLSGLR